MPCQILRTADSTLLDFRACIMWKSSPCAPNCPRKPYNTPRRFQRAWMAYVQLQNIDYSSTIGCRCPAAAAVQDPAGAAGAMLEYPAGVPRNVVMDGLMLSHTGQPVGSCPPPLAALLCSARYGT